MHKKLGFIVLLGVLTAGAHASDHVEWVGPNSGINWTNGTAVAAGAGIAKEGTPPSLAKMQACRAAVAMRKGTS